MINDIELCRYYTSCDVVILIGELEDEEVYKFY